MDGEEYLNEVNKGYSIMKLTEDELKASQNLLSMLWGMGHKVDSSSGTLKRAALWSITNMSARLRALEEKPKTDAMGYHA